MCLHQSANLEYNLYHTCDTWHMHQDWKIERWEEEYVYTHIRVAHLGFRNLELPHYHHMMQVALRAEVAPVPLEVHPCLCTCRMSAESLLYRFGKEGSPLAEFHEPLPGVFISQPSPLDAQDTQLHSSSLLRLRCKARWSASEFPLLWCAKSILGPF